MSEVETCAICGRAFAEREGRYRFAEGVLCLDCGPPTAAKILRMGKST